MLYLNSSWAVALLDLIINFVIILDKINLHIFFSFRKKIENIGKMTQMTQEEIITNTKTVIQGLEALKNEHNSILNGLLTSLKAVQQEKPNDSNVVEEKTTIIKKTLESIELGLGEAQVSYFGPSFYFLSFEISYIA